MTRFDATEPAERRKLYVDAIAAHRERESTFLTFEADDAVLEADADGLTRRETTPGSEDGLDDAPPAELGVPWIQFGDGTVNLDCTDAELETLKTVIGEFSAFKIDELIRPEEAEGSTPGSARKADPNRIAQFVDEVFLEVYDLPAGFRVWVAEV